jgi:thiamine pyrophosphokinase
MKYLIVSNGSIKDIELIKQIAQRTDFIICADGGIKHLFKANILPDLVIGDLDSISEDERLEISKRNIKVLKYPTKKDKTDTELAIDYAIENDAEEILLLGATGTRLDHTIANIMILFRLLRLGIKGCIIDSHNEVYIVDSELELQQKEDTYVSIIPLMNDAIGVTLKGFEYETENKDFKMSSTLGISNRIIYEKGYINIKKGPCLVIRSRD